MVEQTTEPEFISPLKMCVTAIAGSTQIHRQSYARNNQLARRANVRLLRLASAASWLPSAWLLIMLLLSAGHINLGENVLAAISSIYVLSYLWL